MLDERSFKSDFQRCLQSGEVPCPPMHLITTFGTGAYELHPWNARSWEKPAPGDEDFCIKREEYTNESQTSRCKVEPGCMSC
eukprot:5027613-Prymnesium_polylepis.1